ncbi:NADPH2:quinone reductase [Ancylomarina subtilis]|uniref:NADPH2:quinone reductase n=1 Tax=Ancylomarina subtilis TaxID=1639035 RepID=A0A4Q7V7M4_9BACT|nr:zinc-binding dehydrogenase [Ancylomarina subtilis]RZT91313.1 NADPH2:quinone reductase [Ancylomarina subtilis]
MKAVVIESYGDHTQFLVREVSNPEITDDQVLVKVEGTNINPSDLMIRKGLLPFIQEFPAILHTDVVGEVVKIGNNVEKFKVGQRVIGFAGVLSGRQGALADLMAIDETLLASAPDHLSLMELAALPMISVTAWEAVVDKAKLQKGETVLIHGGVGGVGSIAVQIAKSLGAKVYTTVGNDKDVELALQLGADFAINYKSKLVSDYVNEYTSGKGFDVVIDTVGGPNFDISLKATALYGRLVSTYLWDKVDLSEAAQKSISVFPINIWIPMMANIRLDYHSSILEEIGKLVTSNQLRPLVNSKVFNFNEVAEAHQFAESKTEIGKVVLLNN